MDYTTILITGDLVITESWNKEIIIEKNLKKLFRKSDYNITNLECPVTNLDRESEIIKTGPNIKGNERLLKHLFSELNMNLATLANNHILDYGQLGLDDTISFCKKNNIETVGAGENLEKSRKSLKTSLNNNSISIINFAENEWASASEYKGGAHPMNVVDNCRKIKEARCNSDIVIVIVHGGHEYYNLPSPRMKNLYRFYVEEGADIVIGHHPHCISGFEIYKGASIFYSLGNFLFTHESKYSDWYLGFVLSVKICNKAIQSTELIPVYQKKGTFELGMLENNFKLNQKINQLCKIIDNDIQLEKEWVNFINEKTKYYSSNFSILPYIPIPFFTSIIRRLGLSTLFKNKRANRWKLNILRCESHRDLSIEILKNEI